MGFDYALLVMAGTYQDKVRVLFRSNCSLRQSKSPSIHPKAVMQSDSSGGQVRVVAGSYLRFMHSCITQLKAQGPSRTCNESKEEEVSDSSGGQVRVVAAALRRHSHGARPVHLIIMMT